MRRAASIVNSIRSPIANRTAISVMGCISPSAALVATKETPHRMTASRAPRRGGMGPRSVRDPAEHSRISGRARP